MSSFELEKMRFAFQYLPPNYALAKVGMTVVEGEAASDT